MKKIMLLSIFLIFFLMICSEEPELTNPYGKNVDPVEWAPSDLQVEEINIHTAKLTWRQLEEQIEGFKIDRKIGDEEWIIGYATTDRNDTTFIDTNAIPTVTNYYRVYAYAGKNSSNEISKSLAINFPAPDSLQLKQLDAITIKLEWQDNSNGEDGFKIDRKKVGDDWSEQLVVLDENQTTWIDTTVKPNEGYEYRVYGFRNQKISNKIDASINTQFPYPTDLKLTQKSLTEVELSWQDNCDFEDGYCLDKKVEGENWLEKYVTLDNNSTFFIDTNAVPNKVNYYRVYAIFKEKESEKNNNEFLYCVDIDGNLYSSVKIGNQWWIKENLKVSKFRNRESIQKVENQSDWSNNGQTELSSYCLYNNDENNAEFYGYLYNWYAVNDNRGIAPEGWHIPSDQEWQILADYISNDNGGYNRDGDSWSNVGNHLKATSGWESDGNGTNDYGFAGLPAGYRNNVAFIGFGSCTNFWSITEYDTQNALYWNLYYYFSDFERRNISKNLGFSVRCIKDE